jgi:hypothetical protein
MVMLSDAVTAKKQSGDAKETVEVLDVAQLLSRSLAAVPVGVGATSAGAPDTGAAPVDASPEATASADTPQLSDDAATGDSGTNGSPDGGGSPSA